MIPTGKRGTVASAEAAPDDAGDVPLPCAICRRTDWTTSVVTNYGQRYCPQCWKARLPPRRTPPLLWPRSQYAKKQLSRLDVAFGKRLSNDEPGRMPRSRLECLGKPEPCPYVRCRHHLATDVNEIGSLKLNFPTWTILDLEESCSLNVARRGPQTTERVASLMNLSAERVRQIEREAGRKVARVIDPGRLLRGPRRTRS